MRGARSDDFQSRQLRILNSQTTSGTAPSIDQDSLSALARLTRQREIQRLVKSLSNGRNTHTQRSRFFEAEILRDLNLEVAFRGYVVCEGAVFVIDLVAAVGEARDPRAFLERFGYCTSDFFDNAGVVTTDLDILVSYFGYIGCAKLGYVKLTLAPAVVT